MAASTAAAAAMSAALRRAHAALPTGSADHTLRIQPLRLELAPGIVVDTVGYNGTVPGPLLRLKEGISVDIDVWNETKVPSWCIGTGCTSTRLTTVQWKRDLL